MNYKKVTTGIIVVWFLFALSASALQLFKNDANRIGISVAIAALVPLIVSRYGSRPHRHFASSRYLCLRVP